MHITLVKKILKDGSACKKCADVLNRLNKNDQMKFIDETLTADERDLNSPGMLLAKELGIEQAPFFVVTTNGTQKVYTVYFQFVKEVLQQKTDAKEDAQDILDQNSDLDFL